MSEATSRTPDPGGPVRASPAECELNNVEWLQGEVERQTRTIEGQRKHIARLLAQIAELERCTFGGSYGRCKLKAGHGGGHDLEIDGGS